MFTSWKYEACTRVKTQYNLPWFSDGSANKLSLHSSSVTWAPPGDYPVVEAGASAPVLPAALPQSDWDCQNYCWVSGWGCTLLLFPSRAGHKDPVRATERYRTSHVTPPTAHLSLSRHHLCHCLACSQAGHLIEHHAPVEQIFHPPPPVALAHASVVCLLAPLEAPAHASGAHEFSWSGRHIPVMVQWCFNVFKWYSSLHSGLV